MRTNLRLGATAATLAVLAATLASPPALGDGGQMSAVSAISAERTVTVRLRAAITNLPVARETRAGYDRARFDHWIDADGDCRDTRDEVLAAESLVAVQGCDIQSGKWRSWYDGAVTMDSTAFDVDHMVALAEAWDSGAKRWTAETRTRFANDLGDGRSLVAVSASSNRSKSDQDPSEWLPRFNKCRYVRHWVAVKIRWRLKVNTAEKQALTSIASGCDNGEITVRRASVQTLG